MEKSNINVDVANQHCLVSLETEKGREFNEHMHKIMDKLFENEPLQKAVIDGLEFDFYIQDVKDESIARVRSKEDVDAWKLEGDRFAVMFNKEKLQKVTSEDELAFIMGHEISHVLWNKEVGAVTEGTIDEELACDFNSMNLMKKAGYSLSVIRDIDKKLHPYQNPEMIARKEERDSKLSMLFFSHDTKPFDATQYAGATFERHTNKYEFPSKEDTEEVALDKMMKNFEMVYKNGGRYDYDEVLASYIGGLDSEKASKLFMNMVAKVTEKFPPVDEVTASDKKQIFKHPISILTTASGRVSALEGKKLVPPAAQAKLNKYIKENPKYFEKMDFAWDQWSKPPMTMGGNQR